jgi:heptosyltransferase-2
MKILVIQTAFIGDVILITPLLRQLKAVYPDSDIDVLVVPQCAKLLENNPNVHEVVVMDKKKKSFLSFIKFIKKMKTKNYDISISPHSSFRSGVLTLFANIKTRIGFKRYFQQILLTHSIPHPNKIHKKEKNLKLLSLIPHHLSESHANTELFPSPTDYEKTSPLLSTCLRPIILVAPGSAWFTKRWCIGNYVVLVERLINDNYFIVISGSVAEKGICDYIYQNISKKDRVKNIAGEYNLLEVATIIQKVDLVVCNDSGTMHIANAMDTPVFAFFGPTVKDIGYYPYREKDLVFEVDLPCRPCGSHGGKECPKKTFDCMKNIKVDVVIDKIKEYFQ